jgi:chromosome segregation ATPase
MLNPLELPGEVAAALRSVVAIERSLDDLPERIEATLRSHFEGQRSDLAELHSELVANRRQAEQLPPKVDGLREEIVGVRDEVASARDEIAGLREELRAVLAEIGEVRETVEPLQGPAERLARLDERLPGGG